MVVTQHAYSHGERLHCLSFYIFKIWRFQKGRIKLNASLYLNFSHTEHSPHNNAKIYKKAEQCNAQGKDVAWQI